MDYRTALESLETEIAQAQVEHDAAQEAWTAAQVAWEEKATHLRNLVAARDALKRLLDGDSPPDPEE